MKRGIINLRKLMILAVVAVITALIFIGTVPVWATTTWNVPGDGSNTCTTINPSCDTIQGAINAAASGDTIDVAAGTYNQAVLIDKPLTLNGANAGVNPVTETRGDESVIEGAGPYLVNISGSDVVFDGFKVQNAPVFGMWTSGVGSTIQNNIVDNSSGLGVIVAPGNNTAILNNLITNNWDGIYLEFVTTNVTISGNKITGSDGTPEGAITFEFYGTYTDITIENNIIKDNAGSGIYFWGPLTLSGIEIHFNNIYDNAGYGVLNEVATTVDAECNWWGSRRGPTHSSNPAGTGDSVSNNVDFRPWLPASYPSAQATGCERGVVPHP